MTMPPIEIGCGQITWDQFRPQGADPQEWEARVLGEIAQAGYAGAPAGPWGGRSAREGIDVFARHGLKPAPGCLGADFWRAERRDQILEQARAYARFMREAGCAELYVAAGGFDDHRTARGLTRRQIAGHVRPED